MENSGKKFDKLEDDDKTKGSWKFLDIQIDAQIGVSIIQIRRGNALNALNEQLVLELLDSLHQLDEDKHTRAIIITGYEDVFVAGADLKELHAKNFQSVVTEDTFNSWHHVDKIKKPLIAAVNGFALGGGCELAMMCDIIVASDKASFGQPEIFIGTVPGMGGSQRLPRLIGSKKAMEWILTGRRIDAQEAFQAGLVSCIVPHNKLLDETISLAANIASKSLPLVIAAKECVKRSDEISLQEGLLYERRMFHSTFGLEDRLEGMTAFIEKRSPVWKHR